jgi:DNA-directed RNA polymerase subunit RPC12/RpoP
MTIYHCPKCGRRFKRHGIKPTRCPHCGQRLVFAPAP